VIINSIFYCLYTDIDYWGYWEISNLNYYCKYGFEAETKQKIKPLKIKLMWLVEKKNWYKLRKSLTSQSKMAQTDSFQKSNKKLYKIKIYLSKSK
jgi:hypothetical protein